MKRLLLIGLAALTVGARAQIFDFEGETATMSNYTPTGDYTSLTLSDVFSDLTLTRENGANFDITDNSTFSSSGFTMPSAWGNNSLSPFSSSAGNPFLGVFSTAVTSVGVDFGDFGSDFDVLLLEALDEFDQVISSSSVDYDQTRSVGGDDFETLTVSSATPFTKIRFGGGSVNFPQSVYIDNITYEPVPEPATLLILGGAVGALAVKRRRKSMQK